MPIGKDSIKTRVAKVAAEAPAEAAKVETPAEVKPAAPKKATTKKPAAKAASAPKAPKAEGEAAGITELESLAAAARDAAVLFELREIIRQEREQYEALEALLLEL